MGRFSPSVEQIRLPPAELAGGKLVADLCDDSTVSHSSMRPGAARLPSYLWKRAMGREVALPKGTFAIELRSLAPGNWSHSINHHLLQALLVRRYLRETSSASVRVILPEGIPRYITRLYEIFGFEKVVTDLPVRGAVATFFEEPFSCHRCVMNKLVSELVHDTPLSSQLLAPRASLPQKVFLSRRDTRRVKNESEVESFLSKRGFTKVYPELLSIEEQFSLFANVTHLVGVHGAGLGPLAYRLPDRPCQFIELLSPGHMTDFYRFIGHQIGASWIGVRGRLWPELVRHAHQFDEPFRKYSLSDFTVDLASLEVALELVGRPASAPK